MSHLVQISPHEKLLHRTVPGFGCTDFLQPPKLTIPAHAHPEPILLFVLGGRMVESSNSRRAECQPATVLFRPAGETHRHTYGEGGARCLAVEIQPSLLEEHRLLRNLSRSFQLVQDGSLFARGLKLLQQMRHFQAEPAIAMEEILHSTLGTLSGWQSCESSLGAPPWLQRAHEMVQECFTSELSLAEIAHAVGVHPVYLADTHRKYYGASIGKTIRRLRLDYALRELMGTEKSIVDVAMQSGFYDQAHFTNFVRQHTGLSPAQLRKLVR